VTCRELNPSLAIILAELSQLYFTARAHSVQPGMQNSASKHQDATPVSRCHDDVRMFVRETECAGVSGDSEHALHYSLLRLLIAAHITLLALETAVTESW
jgi:hypothetical protein